MTSKTFIFIIMLGLLTLAFSPGQQGVPTRPTISIDANNGQTASEAIYSFCWPVAIGDNRCDFLAQPQPANPVEVGQGGQITVIIENSPGSPVRLEAAILNIPLASVIELTPAEQAFLSVDDLLVGQNVVQITAQYQNVGGVQQAYVSYVFEINVLGTEIAQAPSPTTEVTATATEVPTEKPTAVPTEKPTQVPPTTVPTSKPTEVPTQQATATKPPPPATNTSTPIPSIVATEEVTEEPTTELALATEEVATEEPTEVPTQEPTQIPTEKPTQIPPTATPTEEATEEPTAVPTEEPTEEPTEVPTATPIPTEEGGTVISLVPTQEMTEEAEALPTATTVGLVQTEEATEEAEPRPTFTTVPLIPQGNTAEVEAPTEVPELKLVFAGDEFDPAGVSFCQTDATGEQTCTDAALPRDPQAVILLQNAAVQVQLGDSPIPEQIEMTFQDASTLAEAQSGTVEGDQLVLFNVEVQPGAYILKVIATWGNTSAEYFFRVTVN
jgi:hypothetical protein